MERIYDQTSSNIDYDNPNKLYIPDKKASEDTPEQELRTEENTKWEDVVEKDLPDNLGEDNAEQPAQTTEYRRESGTVNGEAPKAKSGQGTKRPDASGKKSKRKSEPNPESGAVGDQVPNKSADQGNQENKHEDEEDKFGSDPGVKPADPDDDNYLERVYDSTYGNIEDLPTDVKTIAAIGELALIAQVVGNDDTLVGTSEDYLGRAAIQDVFATKLQKAKALWNGTGEETTNADAEAIIKAGPDACVVYSGQLSGDLERLIAQNRPDMKIITLPKPTSATNIEIEFRSLGRLLSEATEGESENRAQRYLDFVDEVVSDAESAHGGGVVTYASVDYNNTDDTRIAQVDNPSGNQLWTLYISGWDYDAAATAMYEGSVLFEDVGAAYTQIGWSWSPLSYYMSVGGIINNAAAYGPLSTQKLQPVLTLNQQQVTYTWKNFCVKVDESRGGGSFPLYRANYTLTNARDAVDRASASGFSSNDLHQLGSADFSTVIVKTGNIRDALELACGNENGLYTLYGMASTGSTTACGRVYSGSKGESIIRSTVNGDAGYRVLVNPCGYVGSWTDGSIEAPLEALWVASEFWGYDKQALRQRIADFYAEFYDGYEPDVDEILKGSYAQDDEE